MTSGTDDAPADDRQAILDALRAPFPSATPGAVTGASEPAEPDTGPEAKITSWMDLIEDDDWLHDDDSDAPAPVAPFPCPDVAADIRRALSDITSRPTHDYEVHYQQGYAVFRTAGARLSKLIEEARAAGVTDTDDPRVAPLAAQLQRVEELRAEHVRRHEEYRAHLHPVTGRFGRQIAEDDRKSFAERRAISNDANAVVSGIMRDIGTGSRAAAARRFDDWLYNFNSTW